MLYLSAQPDDYYFIWQLEIQLMNFKNLGIKKEDIHILIGVNSVIGARHYFSDFIEDNVENACFFIYEDKRESKNYLSSIRPHIIKQHFEKFPELEKENIFYHDSDIIFRELPDFGLLCMSNTWYVSDARNYLDSRYIISSSNDMLFKKMCRQVGLSTELVISKDEDAGGAQYLLKNTNYTFWDKAERDSEVLYNLMQDHNYNGAEYEYIKNGKKRSEYKGIQSWCADMWAILWNAWYFNYEVKIHPELDFCWPFDLLEAWNRKKILHYSGIIPKENKSIFRKGNYLKFGPFYEKELENISASNCSYALVQLIHEYKKALDSKRISLKEVTFLIPVRIDSEGRLENLYFVTWYLEKYFDTNIIIVESDGTQKVDTSLLPQNCEYHFFYDGSPLFFHTKINNWLIKKAMTKIIAVYDTDVIIPVEQITQSVDLIKNNYCEMVSPYDGSFTSVDSLFKEMFGKILDPQLFCLNKNKFITGVKRSYGGAVFIKSDVYLNSGMENEYFKSWGPEDIERQKRMRNLGYTVKRINGPLFHLPHERLANSAYNNTQLREEYMNEYLKICRMKKKELKNYIATWPWSKKIAIANDN
ncbi:MAG TPA: galactosyltransferase-related protein [Hanamia sp.]